VDAYFAVWAEGRRAATARKRLVLFVAHAQSVGGKLHIHFRSKAASPYVRSRVSVRLGNVPVDVKVACIRWQLDDHPVEFLGEYDLAA